MRSTNSQKDSGEFEHFCSQCCCRKWFQRTCGVFVLFCIVSLATCVYCTIVLNTIRGISDSCKIKEGNTQSNGVAKSAEDINHTLTQVNHEKTNDLHLHDVVSRTKRGGKKKSKPPKILAEQYDLKPMEEHFEDLSGYNDRKMINTCKYVKDLKGTLCKTGDFKSETKTLHVFQPASYLKPKSRPLKIKNGQFVAKKKGLYLVYAQVLFYDSKEFQEMKVVNWEKDTNSVVSENACVRSVRGVDKHVNNTCSVTAIYFLNKGDYLTVDLSDIDINLNFSHKNTFLGAILLR